MTTEFCIVVGEVVKGTERAVLVDVGDRQVWIPRSVIDDGEDLKEDPWARQELHVAEWFVDKENL